MTSRGLLLIAAVLAAVSIVLTAEAVAQDGRFHLPPRPSLPNRPAMPDRLPQNPLYPDRSPLSADPFFSPDRAPRSIKLDSWTYVGEQQPLEIKMHDLITVIVDEKSEVTSNSRFNRSRQAVLKAQLNEFIRIGRTGNLRPAAENSQPTIDGNLNARFNGTGQQTDQEGIRYRIAATVVDVLPNGNVVLEARKTIQTNRDIWSYTLTGILRSADIARNNTALSENIYDLKIKRMKTGKVNDSARLPWGVRLIDKFFPF